MTQSPQERVARYEEIIRPLEAQMIRTVWRVAKDADDAEDAMQEALTVVWRRFDKITTHQNPKALILRICLNAACDVLRRKSRMSRNQQMIEWKEEIRQELRQPGSTALKNLQLEDLEKEINYAISQLSPQQSTAVRMRLFQHEPYDKIASALNCTEATARTHVARGRARLQELLAHLNPSPHPA